MYILEKQTMSNAFTAVSQWHLCDKAVKPVILTGVHNNTG